MGSERPSINAQAGGLKLDHIPALDEPILTSNRQAEERGGGDYIRLSPSNRGQQPSVLSNPTPSNAVQQTLSIASASPSKTPK